jgi:hypothetical protein
MRAVQVGDLIAVARVLVQRDHSSWAGVLDEFLAQAHAAHLYHKRLQRPHPIWGNGSLMARAYGDFGASPLPDRHSGFLAALQATLVAIVAWREQRASGVSSAQSRAMIQSMEGRACQIQNPN